jgi:hypothetical protein
MTRAVHPVPVGTNVFSVSTPTMDSSKTPNESIVMQRLHPHPGAPLIPAPTLTMPAGLPAVPITVTTASHPDPGLLSSSQRQNIQLTTGGGVLQKRLYHPDAKLAGPEGGFTLPCGEPDSVLPPPVPTTPLAPVQKSASASPLVRGYSAASIASIHAQGTQKTLGRRTHSAPNAVVLTNNKSKFKYQKVVGGKSSPGSMAVSSCHAQLYPRLLDPRSRDSVFLVAAEAGSRNFTSNLSGQDAYIARLLYE